MGVVDGERSEGSDDPRSLGSQGPRDPTALRTNVVDEIDEENNTARFEAPTPIVTRPPSCTPTVLP